MKTFLLYFFSLCLLCSCGDNKGKVIPLAKIDKFVIKVGKEAAQDFFTLARTNEGLKTYKGKYYITPKMHAKITIGSLQMAPFLLSDNFGTVEKLTLFHAKKKKHNVIELYFKVKTSKNENNSELIVDINRENHLSDLKLFVKDSEGYINVFP